MFIHLFFRHTEFFIEYLALPKDFYFDFLTGLRKTDFINSALFGIAIFIIWYVNDIVSKQNASASCTANEYCYAYLESNHTHHDDSVICSIDLGSTITNSSAFTISNYTTALSIENSTNTPVQNTEMYFYANYTSVLHPVSGIGLNDYEISRVIWANDSETAQAVTLFDCLNSGERNCPVVNDGNIFAFYPNGTYLFSSSPYGGSSYKVTHGDMDDDGFENEVILITPGGSVVVFNESGDEYFKENYNYLNDIIIADIDHDGIKNDVVLGGESELLVLLNSSGSWVLHFNSSADVIQETFTQSVIEVAVGDFDRDGFEDDFAGVDHDGEHVAVFSDNGTLLFHVTLTDIIYSVQAIDIDHDGFKDEMIVGGAGDIYAFRWNGTENATYTSSDAIWTDSFPGGGISDIYVLDLDEDGWEDDFVITDSGSYGGNNAYIWAFDNDSNHIWNFSFTKAVNGYNLMYSVYAGDIDDDGKIDIFSGDEDNMMFYALNLSGSLLFNYDVESLNVAIHPTSWNRYAPPALAPTNTSSILSPLTSETSLAGLVPAYAPILPPT
jgi:hypothetical protein